MTKLSVNINKIATLRNARGGNNPDVVKSALNIERYGARGITVHPRPDERHIRYSDVRELAGVLSTEFNIEGYPSEEFIELVCEVQPTQVTLVPDSPEQITSNHGWDIPRHLGELTDIVGRFKEHGIRTSIFIDAQSELPSFAKQTGADRVELYTEPYAKDFLTDPKEAIKPFIDTAIACKEIGLGLNAGHDLNLQNLAYFKAQIPFLDEVSIGHALICDALYMGLQSAVRKYLACLE